MARFGKRVRVLGRAVDELEDVRSNLLRSYAVRDAPIIASAVPDMDTVLDASPALPRLSTAFPAVRSMLTEIEDRRVRSPAIAGGLPRRSSTRRARLKLPTRSQGRPGQMPRFADARFVLICVRRKRRREVMFARAGGGRPRAFRRSRRGPYSNIWC